LVEHKIRTGIQGQLMIRPHGAQGAEPVVVIVLHPYAAALLHPNDAHKQRRVQQHAGRAYIHKQRAPGFLAGRAPQGRYPASDHKKADGNGSGGQRVRQTKTERDQRRQDHAVRQVFFRRAAPTRSDAHCGPQCGQKKKDVKHRCSLHLSVCPIISPF